MRSASIGRLLVLPGAAFLGGMAIATAQDQPPPGAAAGTGQGVGAHMTPAIRSNDMVNMHGMHTMAATVTDTDPKSGIVDVMAEGMALRVQFPPASMVDLKAGDKIGLYMGYSHASVVK